MRLFISKQQKGMPFYNFSPEPRRQHTEEEKKDAAEKAAAKRKKEDAAMVRLSRTASKFEAHCQAAREEQLSAPRQARVPRKDPLRGEMWTEVSRGQPVEEHGVVTRLATFKSPGGTTSTEVKMFPTPERLFADGSNGNTLGVNRKRLHRALEKTGRF